MSLVLEPVYYAYGALIILAVLPIIFGSMMAMENDDGKVDEVDRLSTSDAYWFPIIGSIALFSFYLVFKFFPKEYINYLLTAYFAVFGWLSLTKLSVRLAQFVVPKNAEMTGSFQIKVTNKDGSETLVDFYLTWLNVLLGIASAVFTGFYVWSKNWIASNVFGFAFSTTAVAMIHIDNFSTGMILLSGLFIYDIFWVFGTDVMVTVAKNFDAPVKMLFPRDILSNATSNFAILGLGDIVLPGVYLALCRKFDAHIKSKAFFTTGMIFYFLGLATTMYVMHTFKAAQPALLYLSPACILSSLSVALIKGCLGQFFAFDTSNTNQATSSPTKSKKKAVKSE